MMKKVLYGVALTLFAGVSVGSLQSCKDDVADLRTQTSYDLNALQIDIQKKLAELEEKINRKADAQGNATLEDLKAYATLQYVNELIFGNNPANQEDLEKIKNAGGLLKMIEGALASIPDACDCAAFKDKINNLLYPQGSSQPADYGDSTDMIAYLMGRIGANKTSIDEIIKYLGVETDEDGVLNYVKSLKDQLDEIEENMTEDAEDLDNLLEEVMKIENDFLQTIEDRITGLITSIKIERAVSPVFGDLSLPIGIKSNVLFNWYGYSDRSGAVKFPTDMVGLVGEGVTLPSGAPSVDIPAGYFDDEVSLGNVYVTLNPVGHVYNGTELSFTTSSGRKLDFTVALTASDKELMHGYTRAESSEITGNGFYEGEVKVSTGDQIESIKLSLDEKLMSAMKNAVKDQSKRNAAALIKALYDQMSGIMPAYALRYDWTSKYYTGNASLKEETSGEGEDATTVQVPSWDSSTSEYAYAVLSSYDLGIAAARPLGFNFLQGEGSSSNKVPTIGNLDNFVQELINKNLDKIKIEGKDMEIVGHKIGFANGEVHVATVNNQLVATVTGVTVDGTDLGEVKTAGYTAPEETSAQINKALSVAIAKVIDGGEVKDETVAKVEASVDIALLQMQKQINEVLADVNGQIHNAFDGISDSANSYLDKAQRAVDLYNKVANKINNFFKDPNHYLQAAVFYKTSNNIGILSSNPNSPTVFKGNGNAITLYLSTYTGEIIAPAYKKYVAVTTPGFTNSGKLNTVLDGSEIAVEVPVAGFESGKVYEITYQAVDYRGFYSTRKCYVKVEK